MSQIQIGTCMGFVLALIAWAIIVEVKNYYLTKENSKLKVKSLHEEATNEVKSLDQSGVAKLLDEEYGPGKKD